LYAASILLFEKGSGREGEGGRVKEGGRERDMKSEAGGRERERE